jgi:hypothetical protein
VKRFIEREDRSQVTLLPECLDDYIAADNPVRVVDALYRRSRTASDCFAVIDAVNVRDGSKCLTVTPTATTESGHTEQRRRGPALRLQA